MVFEIHLSWLSVKDVWEGTPYDVPGVDLEVVLVLNWGAKDMFLPIFENNPSYFQVFLQQLPLFFAK